MPSIPVLDGVHYSEREQWNGEHQLRDAHSSTGSASIRRDQELVITTIRATDVAVGLRRIPAGFYIVVRYSGIEWRTENKRSSVKHNIIEWNGPITIPLDLSATIRLEVYASFELQPMLGSGEQLRRLAVSVEQLLDRSAKGISFSFFPKDRDVVSPCSAIAISVQRGKRDSDGNTSSTSRIFGPYCSITKFRGELEDATNNGHIALSRYRKHGERQDLDHSIRQFQRALEICPPNDPCRAAAQCNLAMVKLILCQAEDTDTSFEDPFQLYHNALITRPVGHVDRPSTLIQLAAIHFAQLQKQRNAINRAQAKVLLHAAIELSSTESHEHRAATFMLQFHVENVGSVQTDGQSLVKRDSSSRLTDEDPGKLSICYLDNLGTSLLARFERLNELNDLEDAISKRKDAVELIPHGHPDRPAHLNNLGTSLFTRFKHFGQSIDLDDTIVTLRDAVDLTRCGHPQKPIRLNNLGSSLLARFQRLRRLSDLEDAISRQIDAIVLTPHGHPHKLTCLNNLGSSFRSRFEALGELSNLDQAISLFSHVASSPIGPIDERFHASQNWVSCARSIRHHSLLHAYSVALGLLPQLAWIGLSLTQRYSELTRDANLVREAAAAALEEGFLETAVEWLEQGRSIVWGELSQLRSSYEQLSSAHPDHASKLQELSVALDHASATREKTLSALWERTQGVTPNMTESSQQVGDRHRRLAIERDKLLQEIRKLPGFERFLLRKEFFHLRASAHSGPVVILNAAETRCDALIVLADVDHVIHAPLPKFTSRRSVDLQTILRGYVRQARDGRRELQDCIGWESFLSPLWRCVVKPVLDALALSIPGDLSRIFWCPTGPFAFLPIHAAGFYDDRFSEPGHKVFDFVISSYIPSLSVLAPSSGPSVVPTCSLRLLAVRQPHSDGQAALPGVTTELNYVSEVIRDSPFAHTSVLEPSVGTVEQVLSLMTETDWVHFACHGIQDATNPTNSGLCLADGRRLKLRDIISVSRPRDGLAFLSACQTATGEKRLSDEAIHIAAAMLFAGYGGVVGSMWSISDRLASVVARDVYEQLFQNNTRPNYRDAARALHDAIGGLRDNGRVPFVEWVPFIHVGL